MAKPVVVIPGDDPPQCQGSPQLERLRSLAEVVLYPTRPETRGEKIGRAGQADVLINSRNSVKWPADVLKELPDLKMITVCGIGVDAIDVEAARAQGITVCNVPGKTAPIVAEHAFGLMFAVAKRAAYQTALIRAGDWVRVDSLFLQGKTLGVVGTGNIGAEMARLGRALGMKVIAWTFNPSAERAARLGVTFVGLEELLRRSDVVSLHLKLTEQSRHLIGETELNRMKPDAVLINVGRGALVDEKALATALGSGRLGGAGIDVFQVEPLPPGHPLRACEQVVLTPHCADMTPEGVELLNEGVVDNVLAFLQGNPRNVMN